MADGQTQMERCPLTERTFYTDLSTDNLYDAMNQGKSYTRSYLSGILLSLIEGLENMSKRRGVYTLARISHADQ